MGGLLVLAPLDGLQNHGLRLRLVKSEAVLTANTFMFCSAKHEWLEPVRNNEKRNTGLTTYVPFLAPLDGLEPTTP